MDNVQGKRRPKAVHLSAKQDIDGADPDVSGHNTDQMP
jgi:hypothetical protein